MATPSEKLENCEVCCAQKAKYTCPKCEVRTCNLTCVNIHKKELNCDGVRDRTKFVPLNEFTDSDLLSDYRLLEQVGKSVNLLQKDESKKFTRFSNLPAHMHKLKQATHQNGCNLHFMPQNFSRHKENTTYLNWKTNELFWRIEWIFPQAENIKWVTKRALDTLRLSELVENVLEPTDSKDCEEDDESTVLNRKILLERIQFYRAAGISGIKVLLKAEKIKNSDSKFHELDVTLSLQENLARKNIIEFPTIYLVLRDHSDMFQIVDTDEEMEEEEPQHQSTNRKRRYGRNKPDKEKNSDKPVNYFFNNDSDSDDQRPRQLDIAKYDDLVKMEY